MSIDFSKAAGVHDDALRLRAERTKVLASNIANVSTPGYQARDIDFAASLTSALGAGPVLGALGSAARERVSAWSVLLWTGVFAVVITLLAFQLWQRGAEPGGGTRLVRRAGRALVLATFGVFLAAAVSTYISALVAQLQAIADWITQLGTVF